MRMPAAHSWLADVQVFLWRFGWVWPLAAVACVLALVLFLAVGPASDALAAAQTQVAQSVRARQASPAPVPPASEGQQLEAIRATLLGPGEPTELIRRMGELAAAEQITLAQGEYVRQVHAETGLVVLHVTQPVKAGYPQVKRYVESVLRQMPNVSLDQVSARRDTVAQSQLDVRLRWTFWIQPAQSVR